MIAQYWMWVAFVAGCLTVAFIRIGDRAIVARRAYLAGVTAARQSEANAHGYVSPVLYRDLDTDEHGFVSRTGPPKYVPPKPRRIKR